MERGMDNLTIESFGASYRAWRSGRSSSKRSPSPTKFGMRTAMTFPTSRPSDDASAKASTVCDDDYSNGPISVLSPNGTTKQVKVKTKGWVQYVGEADLYRIDDPNNSNPNLSLPNDWLKKYGFTEYIPNSSVGPAGVLPYTYTNPNLLAAAKL